jgi:hypothetical protein
MKNFLKMAMMALVLFIGNSALAQTPPPPKPVNGGYSTQAQVGNTDSVTYDAGFAGATSGTSYRDETHLLQTSGGGYVKVTLTHRVSTNTNHSYQRSVINGQQFYQMRSQLEGDSSLHSIPDAYDWD